MTLYENKIYEYLDVIDKHSLVDIDVELQSNLNMLSSAYLFYHLDDFLNIATDANFFIVCTLNTRSIPNNLDYFIYDILHPMKCSQNIVCFTETGLSPDIEEFYNIPNNY